MNTISQLTIDASRQVVNYGRKLLVGVTPELFGIKPTIDDRIVQVNPPAFQYGHLALYPARICGLLGLNTDDPKYDTVKVPQEFADFFKKGSASHHDPECDIYPAMDLIVSSFFNSHEALFEILPEVADQNYYQPNTEEASKDRFPTVGSFVIYLLTAHMNTHFGQICAWRRTVGLPGV